MSSASPPPPPTQYYEESRKALGLDQPLQQPVQQQPEQQQQQHAVGGAPANPATPVPGQAALQGVLGSNHNEPGSGPAAKSQRI